MQENVWKGTAGNVEMSLERRLKASRGVVQLDTKKEGKEDRKKTAKKMTTLSLEVDPLTCQLRCRHKQNDHVRAIVNTYGVRRMPLMSDLNFLGCTGFSI